MARKARQPSDIPPRKRSRWLPLFAAIGIALMVFGLLVVLIPSGGSSDSGDAGSVLPPPTPGAAEAQMRARLQQDPNDVNAMSVLADILANSGRIDEAVPYYEKVIQQKPNDEALRVAFGSALMHANYNGDAEQELLKARELTPSDPQPLYLLGQLYESWQPPRLDDARKMYQAVLDTAPDSSYAARAKDRLSALDIPPAPSGTPIGTP
ncbi:MAG TPA: tetratricopeptide repeat protein [Thermomicrobiaceae bacterium]|nr:tetratricopeptide repeat protein [Thermomicrobiaceae bacterium]